MQPFRCKDARVPVSAGFEELVPKLAKNIGFGTGLELRESRLQLTATNDTPAAARMVFNVSVGVSGLSNPDAADVKDQTFAIQVRYCTVLCGARYLACGRWVACRHTLVGSRHRACCH